MLKIKVSGLILREDKDNGKKQILFVKRGSKTKVFPNFWSLVWGKLKPWETLIDESN